MGDSDDEYDRKRRDKFRGERTGERTGDRTERSTSDFRGGGGGGSSDRRGGGQSRDDWQDNSPPGRKMDKGNYPEYDPYEAKRLKERANFQYQSNDSWQGNRNRAPQNYGEYRQSGGGRGGGGGGGRGDRFSPPSRGHDMGQPPMKRSRTDWGEERRYVPDSGYGYQNNPWGSGGQDSHYSHHGGGSRDSDGLTQPPMMSFKAFLQTQDDNISDEEAIQKFNEYKLEFKRQQLNDFFVNHKDEEWFKIKYHPEESVKRKEELKAALNNRVTVFLDCLDNDWFTKISVDSDQSEQLVKLLDSIVIKLEGGTDLDLKVLDEVESVVKEFEKKKPEAAKVDTPRRKSEEKTKKEKEINDDDDDGELPDEDEPKKEEEVKKEEPEEEEGEAKKEPEKPVEAETKPSRKRKREYNSESGSDSENEDASSQHSEDKNKDVVMDEEEKPKEAVEKNGKDAKESDGEEEKSGEVGEKDESDKKSLKDEEVKDDVVKPRCLHKTASIFLRNLAPTITKQEVEAMCKRYPGFLRVAIADPQHDRRWFRRGWVTFERNVNIKEICWNLNNIRLRDCELGAIVNRDLSRRVRTVNGITSHKQVVRNDIKLAAKIIQNLDKKASLWDDDSDKNCNSDIPSFGLVSKNPVMKNITDFLIEEASAEEEELLGQSTGDGDAGTGDGDGESTSTIDRDETLLKVLDRLLFYLRVVHSVDYYNHCEYPNEDEMPNRCGIMHARGTPPSSKVTQQEIGDYCQTFETKIASFLQPVVKLSEDELSKLGNKDPESEVEKFVVSNTQELSKDKWLCPLSGKKFKGPEFVRKHIFNKHAEKIDEVKKEVEYFNNYLTDPKRPQLPEHPGSRSQKREHPGDRESFGGGGGGGGGYMPQSNFRRYGGGYNNYGGGGGGGGGGRNFGGGGYHREPYRDAYSRPPRGHFNNRGGGNRGGEYRPVVNYRDLDAPREPEEF